MKFIKSLYGKKLKLREKIFNFSQMNPVFFMFVLSSLFLFIKAICFSQPYIYGDELTYKTMAYSYFKYENFYHFNSTNVGVAINIPNFLYQFVISFAFNFGDNFLIAIKLINSLITSLLVFPIYFLTKELSNKQNAIIASFICILIPETNFVFNVMAENLYYPLFVISFYFAFKFIIKQSYLSVVISSLFMSLLYITKPHAIAFIISVEFCILVLMFTALINKDSKILLKYVKLFCCSILAIILFIVIFKVSAQGSVGLKFWDIGFYSNNISDSSLFVLKDFLKMAFAHLAAISILFALPLILSFYTFIVSYKRKDKLTYFNLLFLIICFSLFCMVVKFTNGISGSEHYLRLHARYYYMVYPLFLISFLVNFENLKKIRIHLIIVLIVMAIPQFVLLKSYASNLGFVSDNPGLSWLFFLKDSVLIFVLIFINFAIVMSTYIVKEKKTIALYCSSLIIVFVISTCAHMFMVKEYHHKNALLCSSATQLLKAKIDFTRENIVVIDSGVNYRCSLLFWSEPQFSKVIVMPKDSVITRDLIPDKTDLVFLYDEYNIGNLKYSQKDVVIDKNNKKITILYMKKIDVYEKLSGKWDDHWTKKEFSLKINENFSELNIRLRNWQPSFPNILYVRMDKSTINLNLNNLNIKLPFSTKYDFKLEKTFNPKIEGLNNDDRDLGISIENIYILN